MKKIILFMLMALLFVFNSCGNKGVSKTSWIYEEKIGSLKNTGLLEFLNENECRLTFDGPTMVKLSRIYIYKQEDSMIDLYQKDKESENPNYTIILNNDNKTLVLKDNDYDMEGTIFTKK